MSKNHLPPHSNNNRPLVGENDARLPLSYFNHLHLKQGETHTYALAAYESVVVLVSGTAELEVAGERFSKVGGRRNVFAGKADSVYIPLGAEAKITASSAAVEAFVAGGRYEQTTRPFRIRPEEIEEIRYGSDDTKTHRRINHILGKNAAGKAGRLLVSELFTVGKGGWSGFPPHKHDTDRKNAQGEVIETAFEEIYQFRFNPPSGFAAQFLYAENDCGPVYHVKDKSTFLIDKGYHPVVVAPGYEMYYFTMIVGKTSRSLVQYFHPQQADQVNTIPGIKAMIGGFK